MRVRTYFSPLVGSTEQVVCLPPGGCQVSTFCLSSEYLSVK